MSVLLTNSASTLLASQINDTDLQLAVTTGTGLLFPSPTGVDWFPVVVVAQTGEREIMRATARTGDVITVTRGQEGTTARAFDPGARVDLRVTAAALADFATDADVAALEAELVSEVGDLESALSAAIATLQGQLNAPATTRMSFQQTSAPTGWVKETNAAYNDAAVISTTGSVATDGTVAAGTLFARTATDGHSVTQAQLPSTNLNGTGATNTQGAHTHDYSIFSAAGAQFNIQQGQNTKSLLNTQTGSNGAHSHTVTVTVPLGGSNQQHSHNIDMRVKRYSVIVAQKS